MGELASFGREMDCLTLAPRFKSHLTLVRAGLRTIGALGKQQELGPRSKQARTVTPAGPRANIVFEEHVAISDWLA